DTAFVRRRMPRLRATRLPQALEAAETWWKARPFVEGAELVHIHSNTWMNQVAARLAVRQRRPYVLTHYGTEIWHHDGRDRAFRRFCREARHVTFYSHALLRRARELEVPLRAASVVYPPVADVFRTATTAEREDVRRHLGLSGARMIVNVKRLHPLADHATLLRAFAQVMGRRPEARLLVAGAGEEEARLKTLAAALGVEGAVRFLGLVP